jgi:bacterioferritin (cytochrome b1)
MDIDGFLRDPQSRRRFFHRSGVIAGALGAPAVLLACGDSTTTPNVVTGPDESDRADVEILNGVLDLELMAVAAYKLGAGRLRGSVLAIGKTLLEQEQAHADGLMAAIKDAGGTPNRAKSSYDFPVLRSQSDVLRFAVDIENTAIAAYIDALPKLSQGDLRATAAGIITNEAEHIALLLDAMGRNPVPAAFVIGKVT